MQSHISLDFVYPSLMEESLKLLETNYLFDKKLSFKRYDHCYALPAREVSNANGERCLGGGLYHDGEWVYNSGLNIHSLTPYEFDKQDVEYIDDDVIFLGATSAIWGHTITDGLQHVWWFQTECYLKEYRDKPIYYWGEKRLKGNYLELYKLAGIDISRLHFIDHKMLFKSIIVPDSSFVSCYPTGTHYFREYLYSIDHIISNCKIENTFEKKILFSEKQNSRNWGINEIECIAKGAGYFIVYPEEHSLQEQISFLQSADEVLSFESSVGHNIIFCKPGTHITILRKANYVNIYQVLINKIRDFNINVVDVHLSIMNNERFPYAGPFFVYANSSFCQLLDSKATSFPWHLFKKYIQYCLNDTPQNLSSRLFFPEEYRRILSNEIQTYKDALFSKLSSFSIIPCPKSTKQRIISKFVKNRIRHLI